MLGKRFFNQCTKIIIYRRTRTLFISGPTCTVKGKRTNHYYALKQHYSDPTYSDNYPYIPNTKEWHKGRAYINISVTASNIKEYTSLTGCLCAQLNTSVTISNTKK